MPLPNLSVTRRGMKIYSESTIELRLNLNILKKMLAKSSHFLSSGLDVALNIVGVEKILPRKTSGCGQPRGHLIRVLDERSVSGGGNFCLLRSAILKSV